jgi:predicted amidohydrolase
MDAKPTSAETRLERAEQQLVKAAQEGAELVVLPELFNFGYSYSSDAARRAERTDGPTATWLSRMAARLRVHVAGTLLLRDRGHIYNSLLLASPDGRRFRYDKTHPWGFERAIFREGPGHSVVAQTDLGRIGLLICWDAAHERLWSQLAGEVDLVVICSCPPDIPNATLHLANGCSITLDDLGVFKGLKNAGRRLFGEAIEQQAGWLGVPVINTVGVGRIRTPIPCRTSLSPFVRAARRLPLLGSLEGAELSCEFLPGCKLIDGSGAVLGELSPEAGEAAAVAELKLAHRRSRPRRTQPRIRLPRAAFLISDHLLPRWMKPLYERQLRRK